MRGSKMLLALLVGLCGAGALLHGCDDGQQPPEAAAPSSSAEEAPAPVVERRGPPGARWQLVDDLRADLEAPRHPSDGGGRAWLEHEEAAAPRIVAGEPVRLRFVYEAGPLGIVEGGAVYFQVSPFWGWSLPQTEVAEAPGYTRVSTDAEGVELEPVALYPGELMAIVVRGRALEPGERITVDYGAGNAGARADRYAERNERFWFAVDGDGDGVRKLVPDPPTVDVLPGPPRALVARLPSTARPGQRVRLQLAALDAAGNAGVSLTGPIRLLPVSEGLRAPESVELDEDDHGRVGVEVEVLGPGVHRIEAEAPGGLIAESNPIWVAEDAPRLLWGDLHGHSNFSDGTGTPEDYLSYARDVAALDVIALTDHDHWGMPFLDQRPDRWEEILEQTKRFHEPGRFVTLVGYEWTNWIYGHRHVLYFADRGEVLSSIDSRYESPTQLWDALRGKPVLTFAHHSAGGPIPTDWSIPPDPVLEPLTEVVSVHGSSEAPDSPAPIYSAVAGNFVRDALDRGYRLGLVGSGDSHDGHPGLAHWAAPSGGVAAIWSEDLTREGVLAALRARRVYATNGPRILLRAHLDGHPMGSTLPAPDGGEQELHVHAVSPAPIGRVDVVYDGQVVDSIAGGERRELELRWKTPPLKPGDYLYVRVVQTDGGAAWSSPFFLEAEGGQEGD